MRGLGYVTAFTVAVGGTALGLLAVKAAPDVRQYIEMRKM